MPMTVTEVSFPSEGTLLRAGLYEPAESHLRSADGVPCVVMAHGLGGTRAAGLEPFARRFAENGLYVLCFDYRGFGASEGAPRQVVSVSRQLEDYAAAIAYARAIEAVDPRRIALWGSSFSGAHAIAAAVRDGQVAAASSQGAMMDGLAALFHLRRIAGLGHLLRMVGHAVTDALCALACLPRRLLPVVGRPGETAVLNAPGAQEGYLAIAPPDWRNEISCAWMLTLALYRPNRMAAQLPCPTLFCIATEDNIVPPEAMEDAARRAGERASVRRYPLGHFDLYVGDGFERASQDQVDFFLRTLAVKP